MIHEFGWISQRQKFQRKKEDVWLIIHKHDGEKTAKYQLSNAPVDIAVERLGQMSCSRYWIERAFQDGKGIAGMADYQVSGWTGWHLHMVMTLLAMLFLLELQIDMGKRAPMLTVQDVKEILEIILPKKVVTKDEVRELIKQKHEAHFSMGKAGQF